MVKESLGQLEEDAFAILAIGTIIMVLWHGVWGFLDEFFDTIRRRYGIKKIYLHVASIALVILIIGLWPAILKKL